MRRGRRDRCHIHLSLRLQTPVQERSFGRCVVLRRRTRRNPSDRLRVPICRITKPKCFLIRFSHVCLAHPPLLVHRHPLLITAQHDVFITIAITRPPRPPSRELPMCSRRRRQRRCRGRPFQRSGEWGQCHRRRVEHCAWIFSGLGVCINLKEFWQMWSFLEREKNLGDAERWEMGARTTMAGNALHGPNKNNRHLVLT